MKNYFTHVKKDKFIKTTKNSFFLGFTLAEVLITLGIIGIVAALTIPNLTKKYMDKAIISGVKQAYSILGNAFISAQNEYGPANTWIFDEADGPYAATDGWFAYITQFLQLTEDCGKVKGLYTPCYPQNTKIKTLYGQELSYPMSYRHGGILKNGMYIFLTTSQNMNYASWGFISVDINGAKGPNTYGKDIFVFGIYTQKGWDKSEQPRLLPVGGRDYASIDVPLACLSGNTYTGYLAEGSFTNGDFCTGWIIRYDNVDYLHCKEQLLKNGEHSCTK